MKTIRALVFFALFLVLFACGGPTGPSTTSPEPSPTAAPEQTVSAPAFVPAGGTYTRDQTVALSCATAGAEIRYTTDGSDPGTASTLYSAPIGVTDYGTSVTIKAIAVKGTAISEAASAAYSISGYVYVMNISGSVGISAYSIGHGGALSAITGGTFAAGATPQGAAISPNGAYLYVANSGSVTISAYAIGPGGALSSIGDYFSGSKPTRLAISPNGQYLYATNDGSATGEDGLSAFQIGANGGLSAITTGDFDTGPEPYGIAITPDGRYLYVTNSGGATISSFSIGTGGVLDSITSYYCGDAPMGLVVNPSGFLFATNAGSTGVAGLSGFSIGTDGELTKLTAGTFDTVETPIGLAASPGGNFLYVGSFAWGEIAAYSVGSGGTLSHIHTYTPGGERNDLAISPDGRYLYSSNSASNTGAAGLAAYGILADGTLAALDTSSYPTGTYPYGIVIMP